MKRNKSVYKIEFLILIFLIVLFSIKDNTTKTIYTLVFFGIMLFVLLFIYGKKKDNNVYKVPALRILIAVILFYFIIIFMLGIILGYNRTLFSLNVSTWGEGFIPALLITLIIEHIRYILIKNNIIDIKEICVITILLIFVDICLNFNFASLYSKYRIFLFICITAIPIIAQDSLASYLVYKYGLLPAIVYKLIMNLYIYVLPIMTDLGNYLHSLINVLIPFTIYIVLKNFLKTTNDIKISKRNEKRIHISFTTVPIIFAFIIITVLVSGIFKYQVIAIASNSMTPTFSRGDAIMIEKVEKKDIHIGDIIVFRRKNALISHRVIKIKEKTDKTYFYTKGDTNNVADIDAVKEEDVIGVVRSVLKYIGYPTILFNEMIGG